MGRRQRAKVRSGATFWSRRAAGVWESCSERSQRRSHVALVAAHFRDTSLGSIVVAHEWVACTRPASGPLVLLGALSSGLLSLCVEANRARLSFFVGLITWIIASSLGLKLVTIGNSLLAGIHAASERAS